MNIIEKIKDEPVAFQAILQNILALAVSFGFHLTAQQIGGILMASAAILAFFTRKAVTPVSKLGKGSGGGDSGDDAEPIPLTRSKPPTAPPVTKMVAYTLAGAVLTFAIGTVICGCAGSLENAHARGARARAVVEKAGLGVILPQAEECATLDQEHRTWGAVAEIAGVLAGAGGVSTIPIPEDQKATRVAVATSAIVLGAVAATAVWISQDAAASWARDCASGGVQVQP